MKTSAILRLYNHYYCRLFSTPTFLLLLLPGSHLIQTPIAIKTNPPAPSFLGNMPEPPMPSSTATPPKTPSLSLSAAAAAAAANGNNDDAPTNYHYFAIGSMMNPVSVRNRHLDLEAKVPAQPGFILDYKIQFYGSSGFAEAVYEKGATLHGVVYQDISAQDMLKLDDIERDYQRKQVTAHLYNKTNTNNPPSDPIILENVGVYCRTPEEIERTHTLQLDQPPSERYLQILTDGAKYYGVDPAYIQFLQAHKCRPRPQLSEYISFCSKDSDNGKSGGGTNHQNDDKNDAPASTASRDNNIIPNDKFMTRQQVLSNGNGRNGNPLCMICRGLVLQFCSDGGQADEDFVRSFAATFEHVRLQDVEMFMCRLMYDPKWGVPDSLDQVTDEHSAYMEHQLCEYLNGQNLLHDKWKVVARLKNED